MKQFNTEAVLDKRGRITLSADLLNAAKLEPGDVLNVTVTVDQLENEDILDNLPEDLRELFDMLGIDPDTVREVMRKEGYFV
jgi:bifunctional DNA-binding transcriptional regulator/antitoxin component of YhaV-PrlF toxin-antitoxin module